MIKREVSDNEKKRMIYLRKTGHSLPEIIKITGRGNSTVFSCVKDVKVFSKYRNLLREKQGGSKTRAKYKWEQAKKEARNLIPAIGRLEKLCILLALYWGEGTKNELGLINSDPYLIRTFIKCLNEIGVTRKRLRVSVRIYGDMNKEKSLEFWSRVTNIPKESFAKTNVLFGKKKGKLPHGMCRIRVVKGEKYFKLIMSMIESVKERIARF